MEKIYDRNMWDKIANDYIKKKYYGKGLFEKERKILLSLIPRYSTVLDVGCGTGRHVRFFKTYGIKAVGLDYSKNMIKLARSLTNDSYVIGDAHHLPFKNGSFDFVTCLGNTIGSLRVKEAIKEMLRVARIKIIVEFRHGNGIEKRYVGRHYYFVKTWKEDEVKELLNSLNVNYQILYGQRLKSTFFFYAVVDSKS